MFKEAQKQVDDWVSQYVEGYWKPHEIMVRLLEKSSELAREINRLVQKKSLQKKKMRLKMK